MSGKRKNRKHTGLPKHKKAGSVLTPPLASLPQSSLEFDRDLLPEHLWIASLADMYGLEIAHRPFSDFLDAVDTVWDSAIGMCTGLLTDFGFVPQDRREGFLRDHRDLARAAFHEPIGRILAFFPECPAAWLIDQDALVEVGPLDPDVELDRLRRLVVDLLPGKDAHAGHLRTLPFTRMVKSGKMHLPAGFPLIEVMKRYPTECTELERSMVQSFTRSTTSSFVMASERYKSLTWPKYFWRHNFDLTTCSPTWVPIQGGRPVTMEEGPILESRLAANARAVRAYLDDLPNHLAIDLYDPSGDEVLFGLFSRISRLFVLMLEDPNLWARDTAGIMLRCLADSSITFCYLVRSGSPDELRNFREYGEGQEKLLMLHLQDAYPDDVSMEGRTSDDVAGELGGFLPEVLNIELGHWTKQDARKLAEKAGLTRLYRLVFSPASSDVHGSWMSLKHSNLCRCAEPLHRFHRLPAFTEPSVFLNSIQYAQELYVACIAAGVDKLRYPSLPVPLAGLTDLADDIPG
jgi:hypothetical protein